MGAKFYGTVAAAAISAIAASQGLPRDMSLVVFVAVTMIVWWLDGSMASGATGLLPLVLFPVFGISDAAVICKSYFSDGIVICWGSLLMAQAIEDYKLHEYFAKKLIKSTIKFGLPGVLLGFIVVTGVISMWLSNTATAALMVPLSKAVCDGLRAKSKNGNITSDDADLSISSMLHSPNSPPETANIRGDSQRSSPSSAEHFDMEDLEVAAGCIDLSIAYAATLGGMSTLTGTGANITLLGIYSSTFDRSGGDGASISFLNWMIMFVPLSIINLLLLWIFLSLYIKKHRKINSLVGRFSRIFTCGSDRNVSDVDIHRHRASHTHKSDSSTSATSIEEGHLGYEAWVVLSSFLLLTFLWITRSPPGNWGWSTYLPQPDYVTDGTVAVACCLLLFLFPRSPSTFITARDRVMSLLHGRYDALGDSSVHTGTGISMGTEDGIEMTDRETRMPDSSAHRGDRENPKDSGKGILGWDSVTKLNWDVVFLLGGGFALSRGFQDSGLSVYLSNIAFGEDFDHDSESGESNFTVILVVSSIAACALTNVMSNVAVANIFLPAVICIAPTFMKHPLLLLSPVTLSISLALLFPIGTPPNAIVLANGNISVTSMAMFGLFFTLIFLPNILLYCYYIVPYLLNVFDPNAKDLSIFLNACGK